MPQPSSLTRRRVSPSCAIASMGRARVDGVLDQLLDRAGGPFDDLARGDPVDFDLA
jgi:hypothetical protein